MSPIRDYPCTYANSPGICEDVTRVLDLEFPDAYLHCDTMVLLSKALKEHDNAAFCELPFCHTVEGEALGGHVNYGDAKIGPRAKDYICTTLEEILALPEIDYSKGRIHEVLLACRKLREEGQHVVLEVAGPFTIMNVLIDAQRMFKYMRRQRDVMKEVYWKLGNEMLRYMEQAKNHGVDLISYADSAGGTNILGPKIAEQVVEDFTYEFIKKVNVLADGKTMILLCPKTTFALTGTEKAELKEVPLSGPMRYGEACIEMIGKVKMAGHTCIKNIDHHLSNGIFREIVLL